MAIVGSADSLEALLELARKTEPDVAVVGIPGAGVPDGCVELLMERPRVKVLGIEAHEGRAYLYVLRPEQVEIGEVSPEEVVETIREAARRPALG
jgi:DNA-binding NarL/FixJ family response regulator